MAFNDSGRKNYLVMALSKIQLAKEALALGKGDPAMPTDQFQKFGLWTGTTDNRKMAQDLKDRGLENGQQLIDDTANVNTSDPNSIKNSQSDWKISAMQQILSNAARLKIKTPEEIAANKNALISSLDPKYQQAINNPTFNQLHPNWWKVAHSILTDQYAKYANMNNNNVAKQ